VNTARNRGETLAILVGGGPAPGINGVIRSATIEAINNGLRVIGIFDGFKWLARGDNSKIRDLTIESVSRIHFEGGSILGTSRENPTKSPEKLRNVVQALQNMKVDFLITIGGDDTAFTASKIDEETGSEIEVAHVPKTIDNDLPLPGLISTFGYQTARHYGVQLVQNIMTDAHTTSRWYFVVAMGRKAGHLALGIGKAASATVTVIAEEFGEGLIKLDHVCDVLEGAIIKRRALGRDDGVAVLAEGIAERLDPADLADLDEVERDDHGHIRIAEIPLGVILKNRVRQRLRARGINITIAEKNIGYELRCAPPIPYDCEYTQDLGHAAMRFLLSGDTGAMICIQSGQFVPLYLSDMLDRQSGRTRVRMVDVNTEYYRVARKYQLRIDSSDFENPRWLSRLARAGQLTLEEFTKRFEYLAEDHKRIMGLR
jgi:ATP-dependent phosphofructokinase / diphosphate-dependent phosphofructokinase